MFLDIFCCPNCKRSLSETANGISCCVCGLNVEIINGVPDFFVHAPESLGNLNLVWQRLQGTEEGIPDNISSRFTFYVSRITFHEMRS